MLDAVLWIKLCYDFMEGGIAWHAHPKMSMVLFAIDFIVEWVYDHVIIYDYENFWPKNFCHSRGILFATICGYHINASVRPWNDFATYTCKCYTKLGSILILVIYIYIYI